MGNPRFCFVGGPLRDHNFAPHSKFSQTGIETTQPTTQTPIVTFDDDIYLPSLQVNRGDAHTTRQNVDYGGKGTHCTALQWQAIPKRTTTS
jgi:hypothetical protein